MSNYSWIDGRPRLPAYDPPHTPDAADLFRWRDVVTKRRTGAYALETLLFAQDAALAANDSFVQKALYNAIWKAGEERVQQLVQALKIRFTDPGVVAARAFDYMQRAIEWIVHPKTGEPYKDFGNIRDGFDRFLKNRTLDARRIESRIADSAERAAARAFKKRQRIKKELQEAFDGRRIEMASLLEDETNRTVVSLLLDGDKTWREIAHLAGLPSADAARKRYQRLMERLTAR